VGLSAWVSVVVLSAEWAQEKPAFMSSACNPLCSRRCADHVELQTERCCIHRQ
jgi:hypothetical protein